MTPPPQITTRTLRSRQAPLAGAPLHRHETDLPLRQLKPRPAKRAPAPQEPHRAESPRPDPRREQCRDRGASLHARASRAHSRGPPGTGRTPRRHDQRRSGPNRRPVRRRDPVCGAQAEIARRCQRAEWVQSTSAGVEALLPLMPPGAVLTNASGVHREKGGEFILAAVLMLNYSIPRFASDKQHRRWAPRFESTVAGKRAMLLGVGATTIGVTRSGGRREHVDRSVTFAEIDELLPQTDFLVSSLPLTRETQGMIDRRRLDLL